MLTKTKHPKPVHMDFGIYLTTTLVVFCFNLSVIFFDADKIPLPLYAFKCISIGLLPLIASVVTTIAFIHKKIRDNNPKNVRIASATQQYESFENAKTVHSTS